MSEDKVKVLYIGGYGRSGSTLLVRLLGQIEGLFSVGELRQVWDKGFSTNQLCSCGRPFKECEFWHAVVMEAFGGFQHVDVKAMAELCRTLTRDRFMPQLYVPLLRTARHTERLRTYAYVTSKLYRAILKISGSNIIIDSSKIPVYASCLSEMSDIDLRFVNLIRDSRAVAYSLQRKKIKPEVYWEVQYMETRNPIITAMLWGITNILSQALKYAGVNSMSIRYEDLVRRPHETLLRIAGHLGEDWSDINVFNNEHSAYLGINHTIGGNPNRFQQGMVEICLDTEWQEKMTLIQKYLVTAVTWPLLRSYGYLGK